jgi:hypothetical protein
MVAIKISTAEMYGFSGGSTKDCDVYGFVLTRYPSVVGMTCRKVSRADIIVLCSMAGDPVNDGVKT